MAYRDGAAVITLAKLLSLLAELPADAELWLNPFSLSATQNGRYIALVNCTYGERVEWLDPTPTDAGTGGLLG